jgi:hypothetical protein
MWAIRFEKGNKHVDVQVGIGKQISMWTFRLGKENK